MIENKDMLHLLQIERNHEGNQIWQRVNIYITIEIALHAFLFSRTDSFFDAQFWLLSSFDLVLILNLVFILFWCATLRNNISYYKKVSSMLEAVDAGGAGNILNPFVILSETTKSSKRYTGGTLKNIVRFVMAIGIFDLFLIILM